MVFFSPRNSSRVGQNATREFEANFIYPRSILVPSILLALIILFGNSLVIASYKTNKRLRTRTNAFLVSLAISDFLVGSISMPMWIYSIITEDKGSVAFKAVFKTFDIFAALASIYHLTAISIERYIAVSRPFYYKSLPSLFHRTMIASAWFFSALLASLSPTTVPFSQKISWINRVYSMVLVVSGFALPMVIMAYMYVGIFSVARSLLQRNPHHPLAGLQSTGSLMSRYYQGEKKVAITVALITGLFITAWAPFFTVSVTAAYRSRCLPSSPDSLTWLIAIAKSAHYLNSGVNPLVYARRDSEMRRTFLTLLCLRKITRCLRSDEETPWGFPLRSKSRSRQSAAD